MEKFELIYQDYQRGEIERARDSFRSLNKQEANKFVMWAISFAKDKEGKLLDAEEIQEIIGDLTHINLEL